MIDEQGCCAKHCKDHGRIQGPLYFPQNLHPFCIPGITAGFTNAFQNKFIGNRDQRIPQEDDQDKT
ncbi:MAG: hypothetical protein DI539_26405 [Flavobacterium psychrophilum]|nr:MAG: hypothetical protein DI539_26405 [Flavobacterium psychrophilum]